MFQNILRKITSRKFIVALVGVIVGIAAAFGIEEAEYAQIAGIVTALGSIVTYIIGEAKVDAARESADKYYLTEPDDEDDEDDEIESSPDGEEDSLAVE